MKDGSDQVLRWVVPAAVLALWLISLTLPALDVRGGPSFRGHALLARGWQGVEAGVFSWYANPLLLAAVLACMFRHYRTAAVIAVLSLLLALTSFVAGDLAGARGRAVPPFVLREGFYLWVAAPAGLALWSLACAAGRFPGALRKSPPSGIDRLGRSP